MRFKIRKALPADAEAIAVLEQACFSRPWSMEAIKEELTAPISHLFVATHFRHVVGYAGVQVAADEGYITNVAVAQRYRKKGVGTLLVTALAAFAARERLRFLTLELRQSNLAAAALYSGCGFVQVGLRRGYYDDPREDAVLMTLWMDESGSSIEKK